MIKFYFYLLILLSQTTSAAPSCESLFAVKPKTILADIETKLAAYDYSIMQNFLYKKMDGKNIKVGKIEIIEPRFLFEWQDKEFHDDWIANKGIIKSEMDFILNSDGQTYGRGYYVSLNPTDSRSYGTHLTVFEVREPMALLKMSSTSDFIHSPAVVNELRTLGFAGFRGTTTWLSIINEKYLGDAKKISPATLSKIIDPANQVPTFLQRVLLDIPSIKMKLKRRTLAKFN